MHPTGMLSCFNFSSKALVERLSLYNGNGQNEISSLMSLIMSLIWAISKQLNGTNNNKKSQYFERPSASNAALFRWFKWQIMIGHLGHFLLDFLAHIWTQGTLGHILGPILVIFEICQFLTIPGPFEYFSENGWSQKSKFSQ